MRRKSRNSGANNTSTAPLSSVFGQKTATPDDAFSFSTRPTTGSTLLGVPSLCENGTGVGAAPVAGTSKSYAFGSGPGVKHPFGALFSPSGQQTAGTGFGATPENPDSPFTTTGTATPTYTITPTVEYPGIRPVPLYTAITAMPAYEGASIEELRVQDYKQDLRTASGTRRTSSGASTMPTTSFFGTPASTQSTTSSGFGGGTNSTFGSFSGTPGLANPPVVGAGTSNTSTFGQPSPVVNPGKLQRIEELLRKSVLGEEVVNTQFHLFSAKSSSGRVTKPRVLCVNNVILAESSKYFLQLLGSDVNPADPSLIDLTGDNDIPDDAPIDEYGYESDSDLDDCDDPVPVTNSEGSRMASPTSPRKVGTTNQPEHGSELSEEGFESAGSDTIVVKPVQQNPNEPPSDDKGKARSVASGEERSKNQTAVRLRSLGSRHVLVKDTAYQTWYTLLNYLYTGKFSFLPLRSTIPSGTRRSSTSALDVPRCSAKSMYRLACKVELDPLRSAALVYIRSNLTEFNILKEISGSFVSKHPEILEMELDLLYSWIASSPVIADFTALAWRIARNELPHGADIIVGIYKRLLKERRPFSLNSVPFGSLPSFTVPPMSARTDVGTSKAPAVEARDKTGTSRVVDQGTSVSSPPGNNQSTPDISTVASAKQAASTATWSKEPDAPDGKRMSTEKCK